MFGPTSPGLPYMYLDFLRNCTNHEAKVPSFFSSISGLKAPTFSECTHFSQWSGLAQGRMVDFGPKVPVRS